MLQKTINEGKNGKRWKGKEYTELSVEIKKNGLLIYEMP